MNRTLSIVTMLLVSVASLAACTDSDLDANQGPCTGLDVASCRLDGQCQQAYVDSGFQPAPSPMSCLRVDLSTRSTSTCFGLSHDQCRGRNDCTPMFWQRLGPTDAPEGDPTYDHCEAELSPTAR